MIAFDLTDLTKADELLEKSSFGTEGARQLRARTSAELADRLVEQVAKTPPARTGTTDTDPFAELVEAAKTGDTAAIDELFARLRPLIVRYCRLRIRESASPFVSADEVAQEACLAVLTALPSYRSQEASFLGFVYGIATHKIMDFHRTHSRERPLPVSEATDNSVDSLGPDQQLLRTELGQQLAQLLDTLSETQRDVLTLRLVVGLSVAETAEALSMSPGAVRVCQHRALTKLRSKLTSRSDASTAK